MTDDIPAFVDSVIANDDDPVVMFALEWCEFCWSVRKLFAKLDIPYRTVDLDSVAYQQDARGRRIRDELEKRTGMKTIPQIFIGGEFVGGCTDVFDAWKDGRIQTLLASNRVDFARDAKVDPYTFLPDWLHPR
jgi:cysteine synthase A